MNHQIELGYLVLEVPEPDDRSRPCFADVVGLVPGEPTADATLTWRNDDRSHRIIVQPGPANDAVAVGFEAVDALGVRRRPSNGCARSAPTSSRAAPSRPACAA